MAKLVNKSLIQKMFARAKRQPTDAYIYSDLFEYLRSIEQYEFNVAHENNKKLRDRIVKAMRYKENLEDFFELYQKSLLFEAKNDFDSYLQYLEIKRKPEERFYLPRRNTLKYLVQDMQDLADDKLDELFISQPPRTGKALANDTPVLTRDGWKNHGDIKKGDYVIGMDGKFKKVLYVHPKCMLDMMFEFTNGEKIQCHENHEWLFHDRGRREVHLEEAKYWEGRSIENGGEPGTRGHRYILQLPKREYVEGEKKDLPLDPYTFGVWLGDGANRDPRIANAKEDYAIIEKIAKVYPITWQTEHRDTGVMYYGFGFRKALRGMGMCYNRKGTPKHIPDEYLTASIEQRLELLAGLLDTDGTLRRNEHRYVFSTCEESLRDSFVELINTFGWRVCVVKYEPHLSTSGIQGKKPCYAIGFNPDCYIPCVLERKRLREYSKRRAVAVKSIKRVEPKEGNCITVEGGMYLCGKSMIPTHNTTLILFYMTWLIGRDSEKSNLYSAYSDTITKAFYNGVLETIQDPDTYLWKDIFPEAKIVQTNAQEETLNIDRKKRYPSLTCRSLYGTLNGACDCNGILVSDDLIGGIEEALNPDRLVAAWSKVDNNLIPRAKEGAKLLWVGTRWSINDPSGIRLRLLLDDDKYKNRRFRAKNVPALTKDDESNFQYDYGVGFTTEYYHMRRASFERNNDIASWEAQYMGRPIEREGALFVPDGMRYYNGELPDREPDRVFMAVDPAFGGGDYVASPVCMQYDDDIYVVDVVYSREDKTITQKLLAQAVKKYGVTTMQIEANKSTEGYKDGIQEHLKNMGIRINLTTKPAPPTKSKEQRIFDKAPDIREFMVFKESGKRPKQYDLFMQNVFSFKLLGKNKHDDAPDSLSMAIDMVRRKGTKLELFNRTF